MITAVCDTRQEAEDAADAFQENLGEMTDFMVLHAGKVVAVRIEGVTT